MGQNVSSEFLQLRLKSKKLWDLFVASVFMFLSSNIFLCKIYSGYSVDHLMRVLVSEIVNSLQCDMQFRWDHTFESASVIEIVDGHSDVLYIRLRQDWGYV